MARNYDDVFEDYMEPLCLPYYDKEAEKCRDYMRRELRLSIMYSRDYPWDKELLSDKLETKPYVPTPELPDELQDDYKEFVENYYDLHKKLPILPKNYFKITNYDIKLWLTESKIHRELENYMEFEKAEELSKLIAPHLLSGLQDEEVLRTIAIGFSITISRIARTYFDEGTMVE